MAVSNWIFVYLQQPESSYIVGVRSGEILDLLVAFLLYSYIVSSYALHDWYQLSLFVSGLYTPYCPLYFLITSVRFERIVSLICMMMSTQIYRYISIIHFCKEFINILMLCNAIAWYSIASKRIMRGHNSQHIGRICII